MNMITTTAIATAIPTAAPAMLNDLHHDVDPIFAAIEAHKAANAEWDRRMEDQERLENMLDHYRDDPRWIESERKIHDGRDHNDAAALNLLKVMPTTLGGVMALLQHAIDFNVDGPAFIEELNSRELDSDDERDIERTGQFFLIENVARALREIASRLPVASPPIAGDTRVSVLSRDRKLESFFRQLELAHARAQEVGDQAKKLYDDPRRAAHEATLHSLSWSREIDTVILRRFRWKEGDSTFLNPGNVRRLQSMRFKRPDVESRVAELVAAQDALDAVDLELGIETMGKRWDDAHDVCHRLAKQIKDVPATTIGGLRIKAKALCWCRTNDFDKVDGLEDDCVTTDMQLAASVISDLVAMNAGAPHGAHPPA
ncbi:hypothetical protein AS156_01015 [Bradyrhizobium macuxiense]|uniref:Uncharacterized protein n=1 Tax=Bradyrhizobium macuxiense TaxID=1755647 RepID=A0A109JSJ7_9BRAD|nr:hypothetical protein [Bradyrhizobium macuxiense]KWV54340.1 hypothetical protein AS156_01015 [Bradyrhizobium macuxiense]